MRWNILRRRSKERDQGAGDGSPRVSLAREGNEQIQRLSEAVEKEPWSINFLQLIWTAGPVTVIGLYGGYYVGYGKAPPAQTLIYFISFTVLSGVLGLLAKVIYNMTRGQEREDAEENFRETIDKLADLILGVRDLIVDSQDGEARQREAALQLLRKVNLSAEGVAFACQELTGDAELARLLSRIDTYRRAGLYSRVKDLETSYRERIETALLYLQESSPEAASVLRERFQGKAPHLERGVPRDEHFIERTLAAIEEDNDLIMTLQDVEEMLILAFEMLCGREIPMLTFHYSGRWRLAKALDTLEDRRSRYRIAQARGSNRIRALASYLVDQDIASTEMLPSGLAAETLCERLDEVLTELAAQVHHLASQVRKGWLQELPELRRLSDILGASAKLYKSARTAYQQVGKAHAALLEASEEWNRLSQDLAIDSSRLHLGPGRRGLRIIERVTRLDSEQRLEISAQLAHYMRGEQVERRGRRLFTRRNGSVRALTTESAKRLAIEIAVAMEPYIHLSRPMVQRGFESTNATYLGGLEPDMSASEKVALGMSMAKEVEQDLGPPAEHLAVVLVRHYQVALSEGAQEFLHSTYGARRKVLEVIGNYSPGEARAVSFLSLRPPLVPKPRQEWYRALVRARQQLG